MMMYLFIITLLLIILLGVILFNQRKSYNQIVYTIHKLLGLILSIYILFKIYKYSSSVESIPVFYIGLLITSIVLLFVSGALFTINQSIKKYSRFIHIVGTIGFLVSIVTLINIIL
jgi:predicted membrane protein